MSAYDPKQAFRQVAIMGCSIENRTARPDAADDVRVERHSSHEADDIEGI